MKTEFEKMISGEIYHGMDPEIDTLRTEVEKQLIPLNQTTIREQRPLLESLLGKFGSDSVIRMPFSCEYGKNIFIGDQTFVNAGAVWLDNAPITIGSHVLIGPNSQLFTPTHSLDYRSRRNWETWCLPITIEDDVWIGGNVCICQGVTIGARSVVAAGSVVTSDVPPDTLVGGTPAKVIKALNND
ncbi:acetyltransferase [Photobacterium damselae subsp. damselae]|uniref:Nodulation protein L n=1 Tax=Photobacterium damselae subsp. damselae TaxID=85581 RepID=A0AAD3WYE6_PHODD|nr:sugar O-acetyltransferase [Photobacterium damselae]KAB1183353.1 sugar O-acetyltransferase [Photobacterium damselae subsp. damselae]PSB83923.1 acetyltransferase [Photobacterium damselae subsp. damselae]UKA03566.1 sugar O-acetyltransferase [Photobacterium damselae subsp. damselae]